MWKLRKIRELFPLRPVYGRIEARKPYVRVKRLGVPFEVHLAVLVQLLQVDRHTGVENRIELVAVCAVKVERHEQIDLRVGIDLVCVEGVLQIVELIGIGLLGKDGGAVVVGESCLDHVGIVHEVEHEHVVLLLVSAVQA